LLITGPAGCGKASTIRLLCDELDFDFVEFDIETRLNAVDEEYFDDNTFMECQLSSFCNFIISSQAKTIESRSRTRKLIIIKELPLMMIRLVYVLFNVWFLLPV
jgi:cytidylate kinase